MFGQLLRHGIRTVREGRTPDGPGSRHDHRHLLQ
jgi:hypothetical protein